MIEIRKTEVFGWEAAIRGMRNPLNSWDKSDSDFSIGPNDLKLMQSLAKAGDDHGKFLRMINVQTDITAPRYWWTEFDTYKVGTVANSCSTMHKLTERPLTWDDFSIDERCFGDNLYIDNVYGCMSIDSCFADVIANCNHLREWFLKTGDNRYWRALIQLLPQSYNQKRTVQLNYQVLAHMYFARRNHRLNEWHDFCVWAEGLPYFKEIVVQEG